MRAAYGADDPQYNNALTQDADGLLARLLEVMTPGEFLVGFLPSMKRIPSWFPGAGWRHVLEEFAVWNDRFISVPYNDTKARMVCTIVRYILVSRSVGLRMIQRNGTQKSEYPSMAVELVEDLLVRDVADLVVLLDEGAVGVADATLLLGHHGVARVVRLAHVAVDALPAVLALARLLPAAGRAVAYCCPMLHTTHAG